MNFEIFQKVLALPLSSTENSVLTVLSFHVQRDGNSCFPSYDTIRAESGAANKTISKVIRTMRKVRVIDFKARGHIGTGNGDGGKENNEYFFLFEEHEPYKSKGKWSLSRANHKALEEKIKTAREEVISEMALKASEPKKVNKRPPIPSHSNVTDTVTNTRIHKSQSVNNDVRNAAGLEGYSIPSHLSPIPSQMLRRSKKDAGVSNNIRACEDSTFLPCNEKNTLYKETDIQNSVDAINSALIEESQKMVWQDEDSHPVLNIENAGGIGSPAKDGGTYKRDTERDSLDDSPAQTDDDYTLV